MLDRPPAFNLIWKTIAKPKTRKKINFLFVPTRVAYASLGSPAIPRTSSHSAVPGQAIGPRMGGEGPRAGLGGLCRSRGVLRALGQVLAGVVPDGNPWEACSERDHQLGAVERRDPLRRLRRQGPRAVCREQLSGWSSLRAVAMVRLAAGVGVLSR